MTTALTARERQALELAAQGLTSKEIATAVGLSKYTVDEHIANARRKLQAPSRGAAIAQAVARGLLE